MIDSPTEPRRLRIVPRIKGQPEFLKVMDYARTIKKGIPTRESPLP